MNNEGKLDIQDLIGSLENELRSATNMPLTGKQLVDTASCLDILVDIKNNLPDSLRRANNILETVDDILQTARQQANDILEAARVQGDDILREADANAHQMASEHEITNRAHMQADAIYHEAQEQANAMIARAETHSSQVHEAMMNYIDGTLSSLHSGLVEHMRVIGSEIDNMRDSREQLLRAAPESFRNAPDGYYDMNAVSEEDMRG